MSIESNPSTSGSLASVPEEVLEIFKALAKADASLKPDKTRR